MNKMSLKFPLGPKSKTTTQSHDKEHRSYVERTPAGQSHDNLNVKWHNYVDQIRLNQWKSMINDHQKENLLFVSIWGSH